jgi:hypothetical protein
MIGKQPVFAVVTDNSVPHLFQRVVRVLSVDGDLANIKCGAEITRLPSRGIQSVQNVAFEVGDRVSCERGDATIRDVIWHFKNREPNYYLEFAGKKAPKRFLEKDLAPIVP